MDRERNAPNRFAAVTLVPVRDQRAARHCGKVPTYFISPALFSKNTFEKTAVSACAGK